MTEPGSNSEEQGRHGRDRFPRPDWAEIRAGIAANNDEAERRNLWAEAGRNWLRELAGVLGPDYQVHDLDGFWILSNRRTSKLREIGSLLKRSRIRILTELEGIAVDESLTPLAVLWLENEEQYYEYISYFYPESGEFALSGGMFLPDGYPHFVFPRNDEAWQMEHTIPHELTHALVRRLPLPLWLNEGMAVTLEELVAGVPHARINSEILEEHRAFWTPALIQEFWNGASFARSDAGGHLSYALAQLLVLNLGHDYGRFREFAIRADCIDGGEAAARQIFGVGLGDLVTEFLGVGDWTPRPGSADSAVRLGGN